MKKITNQSPNSVVASYSRRCGTTEALMFNYLECWMIYKKEREKGCRWSSRLECRGSRCWRNEERDATKRLGNRGFRGLIVGTRGAHRSRLSPQLLLHRWEAKRESTQRFIMRIRCSLGVQWDWSRNQARVEMPERNRKNCNKSFARIRI